MVNAKKIIKLGRSSGGRNNVEPSYETAPRQNSLLQD